MKIKQEYINGWSTPNSYSIFITQRYSVRFDPTQIPYWLTDHIRCAYKKIKNRSVHLIMIVEDIENWLVKITNK